MWLDTEDSYSYDSLLALAFNGPFITMYNVILMACIWSGIIILQLLFRSALRAFKTNYRHQKWNKSSFNDIVTITPAERLHVNHYFGFTMGRGTHADGHHSHGQSGVHSLNLHFNPNIIRPPCNLNIQSHTVLVQRNDSR